MKQELFSILYFFSVNQIFRRENQQRLYIIAFYNIFNVTDVE